MTGTEPTMSELTLYTQDAAEKLDYTQDWAAEVGDDAVATSSWAISPAGPALSSASNTDTTATVFVDTVTEGTLYELTNSIVTEAGRIYERTIWIKGETK
jgi:hypothetical protein